MRLARSGARKLGEGRSLDKAPGAFRTISEVADEIDVPQHVLRFWESRFTQIRPMKRGGGRRFYRPEDVDLLRGVRHLLYGEGYTIRGVQRILREHGAAYVQNIWRVDAEPPAGGEGGEAEHEVGALPGVERLEPDLSIFSVPSPRPRERTGEQRPAERAEPTLAAAETVAKPPAGISGEDRRKLLAAFDELVTCRRLIEAALANNDTAERTEPGSRISAK
jgi:DNA-binding transcriptional MerR regulator